MFKVYGNPAKVGWLGWIEDKAGKVRAFVGLDTKIVFMDELGLP